MPCVSLINVWRAHACGSACAEALFAIASSIMSANARAVSSGASCAGDLVSSLVSVPSGVGSVVVVSEGAWSFSGAVVGFVKKERTSVV